MKDFASIRDEVMNSIENRVRQAYNSGYDTGFHDGETAGYNNWQDRQKDGYRKGLEEFHRVCCQGYPVLTDYDGLYIP